jgi:hypothetical protein
LLVPASIVGADLDKQQHTSCGTLFLIIIFQQQNFRLAPHCQFGGSSQNNCMLSRFVNFTTILSLQSPGGGFPFSFLLPLSCAARGLPLGLLNASQFQNTWFPSLLGTSYPKFDQSIGLGVLTRNPENPGSFV